MLRDTMELSKGASMGEKVKYSVGTIDEYSVEWNRATGSAYPFQTTQSSLIDRNGTTAKVIRRLTPKESDLFDVGPMYRVEFSDGFITDAFEDELRA